MRGNELLDRMDLIDPEYVEAADFEPGKCRHLPMGWIATAACLCILLAGAIAGIRPATPPTPTEPTNQTIPPTVTVPITIIDLEPDIIWEPHYNELVQDIALSDGRVFVPCYFTETLSSEELAQITPEKLPESMELAGYAAFLGAAGMEGEPEFFGVWLMIATELPEAELSLQISKYDYWGLWDCVVLGYEPVVSPWEGVDYTLYQWQYEDGLTHLKAEAIREGLTWRYVLSIPTEQAEAGKELLETAIQAFTATPDFSHITADYIPEYINSTLTQEEAFADSDFGSYFLPDVPNDYAPESIRRYKDYRSDYLSGLWCRGYDDLYWCVSRITDEDRNRITAVSDTENYDLSLYPIPRADSVPEELREIVDNPIFLAEELTLEVVKARAYQIQDAGDTDGWRMNFSVLYGDVLVEVRTKDVDPEWLYNQLISLLNP